MNFNVWNIKEMLSVPSSSGNIKSSNWNNNQADCSALSDSQFLFGSQFCPENSETLSAPLDFGANMRYSKETQQNSLESQPSIFTKYQTKPQLFGGDTKDEGLFSLPLPVGKSKGLLKQFEEKKKRAADKCDSETLYNFVSHFGESIHKLQASVEKSEEHLSSRSQSVLDSLETVVKTFQETARVQNNLILEAVQEKVSMQQAILEIQKQAEAKQAEFIEMRSDLKNLEVLIVQQSKDLQKLCEQAVQLIVPGALEEMKRLMSVPRVPGHLKDNTSQTSPSLLQSLNFTKQKIYNSEELVGLQVQASTAAGSPSVASQKAGLFGRGGKVKKQQPRKSQRSWRLAKKRERTPSKTYAFNCRYENMHAPVSDPQEPRAQPRYLQSPKSSTEPVLERAVKTSKPRRAAQRSLLHLSRDNERLSSSSQGDQEISWFSNLSLENSESPLCKKAVKNSLYDLAFDSSDENF